MPNFNPVDLFSVKAQNSISSINEQETNNIDDLIKVQAATDKSHIIHGLLSSWATQQSQERKLRRLYAICFMFILGIQIILLNTVFILIGLDKLNISDIQFNAFFISVFGEIISLVLIITKYLFQKSNDSKLFELFKDI
ncbi:MAG: hypothetical protein AAGU74_10290 [Bacillota bacterium]